MTLRDYFAAKAMQGLMDDEWPGVFVHHSMDRREEYEEGRKKS